MLSRNEDRTQCWRERVSARERAMLLHRRFRRDRGILGSAALDFVTGTATPPIDAYGLRSRMHTHETTGLTLALIAVLSAGCADQGTKQMVIKPKLGASEGGGAAERRVVLFRAEVDVGGEPMEEPWSLHLDGLRLFTIVGPKDARLTSRHSFLPGRPDSASSDAGWGFVALPPGAYQLAFEGTAMRFAMAGAQDFSSEAVPVGRSPASAFVVPPDAASIYIGTFSFTCHEPSSRPDALKIECTALEIRSEGELARQIAQTALSKYGPMQEALASPPGAKPSR